MSDEIQKLLDENLRLKTDLHCLEHDRNILKDELEKLKQELNEGVFTVCALRAEIDEYQAEREAMMKQEPIGQIDAVDNCFIREYFVDLYPDQSFNIGDKVFLHPLPAQQIPEEAIKILESIATNWSLDYRADAEKVLDLLSAIKKGES